MIGTAGNDTINALIAQANDASVVETLESTDGIDGGAGTDTLNVTLDGGAPAAMISNVEVINVRDTSGSTLDLANVTGVEQVWNRGSNDVVLIIDNASTTDITFGVANTAANSVIVFADDAVDGTADELKLALSSASDADISAANASTATNKIEAVSLTVTGDNVADISGVGNAVETLTITGTGSVDLIVDATALATLDAGAMTEALDIDISAASSTELNVETGAGDDRVLIDGDLLIAANDEIVVALGSGTNTLALTNIDTHTAIGTLVFDAATLTGFSAVEFTADTTIGGAATIDFDGITVNSIVFADVVDANGFSLALDNTATTLDVTFEGTFNEVSTDVADLEFVNAEVVNLNVGDDVIGATILGEELTDLTVNVTADAASFGIATAAGDLVTIEGQGDADLDTLTSITLNDTSDDGDAVFIVDLVNTTVVSTIALSGGVATDFTITADNAAFDGAVTINIGDFGVDADGVTAGGLSYTSGANGVRETFKFVGTNIGDITIGTNSFLAGIGATADRLDFSAFAGIDALDDLSIVFGTNTVITAADGQFDGTITITGVDLTTDAVNFIL